MTTTGTPTTLSQDLYAVIARRRDVRAEFSGEAIDADVLRRVLGAAHSAPSVGHSQPWDFVLVADEQKRARFAEHVPVADVSADRLTALVQQNIRPDRTTSPSNEGAA